MNPSFHALVSIHCITVGATGWELFDGVSEKCAALCGTPQGPTVGWGHILWPLLWLATQAVSGFGVQGVNYDSAICYLLNLSLLFCKMGIVTVPPHRGGMPIKWENLKKAVCCSINDSICCGWYCHNDMNMWYFTCLGSKHTSKLTYTALFYSLCCLSTLCIQNSIRISAERLEAWKRACGLAGRTEFNDEMEPCLHFAIKHSWCTVNA